MRLEALRSTSDDKINRPVGCGAGAGMIKEIAGAAEVVRNLVEDIPEVITSLKYNTRDLHRGRESRPPLKQYFPFSY